MPDIERCRELANVFQVTLDDLVNFKSPIKGVGVPPKGKYAFGMVTVGEKGQIVIPAKARKVFDINPGDHLLILGDEERGMAVIKEQDIFEQKNTLENSQFSRVSWTIRGSNPGHPD